MYGLYYFYLGTFILFPSKIQGYKKYELNKSLCLNFAIWDELSQEWVKNWTI